MTTKPWYPMSSFVRRDTIILLPQQIIPRDCFHVQTPMPNSSYKSDIFIKIMQFHHQNHIYYFKYQSRTERNLAVRNRIMGNPHEMTAFIYDFAGTVR